MLNTDTLLAAACTETGLSDFGDPAFRYGLDVLVFAWNTQERLTPSGFERVAASTIATLVQRLKVEEYLKKHPDLLTTPILNPLFVFGLPRTGTTLAINLLSADPARRVLMRWEALATVPPAAKGAQRTDPRYYEEQARLEMSLKYLPHISAMHHEDADSSTECQFAMSPSFCAQLFDSQYDIPAYTDWFLHADYAPAFRYHKRLMQLLQQHNGGAWTFKNPWHALYLDALTTVYPDARLVMTHRDPGDVVGSACSLIHAVRKLYSADVDPIACGQLLLRTFDDMIARTQAYEERHGERSIHHIGYNALVGDPIGEMTRLYRAFDEPLTEAARCAMETMLVAKQAGKHSYRLEDFGLTRSAVHAHFEDYIKRYAIPIRR